ncbi:MAG: hypothetical protein V1809_10640 [Planctomycetota bacterium]
MPATLVKDSLCLHCLRSGSCSLAAVGARPVSSCEEFESGGRGRAAEGAGTGEAGTRPLGLCATCLRRTTCTFPRPEGGIWRCEDFA